MTIAIDSSTPALATANTGNVATTGSFTPPAGAVLAAFAWHDTAGGNTTNSSAASDSQVSAWTIQATRAKPDSGAQNGHVQVSTAVPAAAVATTVTTTGTSTGGSLAAGIYCAVLTGCDTTTPIDTIAEGSSASAVISQLLTTVTTDALVMLINCDWNVAAVPTPAAGETTIVGTGIGAGPDMRIWLVRLTALKNPAGAVTMASTAPTSGNTNNWVAVAFKPAAGGGTQNATATLTATAGLTAAAASDKPATATTTITAARTAAAASDKPVTAALTGTATSTAAAATTKPVTAALTGSAALTAAASSTKPVDAALTVTATLTAAASVGAAAVSIAAAPTFTAALTAAAAGVRPGASTVAVAAALTAAAAATKPSQAGLAVAAALTAAASVVSSSTGLVGQAHGPLPRAPGTVTHTSVSLQGTVG